MQVVFLHIPLWEFDIDDTIKLSLPYVHVKLSTCFGVCKRDSDAGQVYGEARVLGANLQPPGLQGHTSCATCPRSHSEHSSCRGPRGSGMLPEQWISTYPQSTQV